MHARKDTSCRHGKRRHEVDPVPRSLCTCVPAFFPQPLDPAPVLCYNTRVSKERDSGTSSKTIATNKKARHEFEFLETVEAGIELMGTEVKSLRDGHVHIQEGYATIRGGEVLLKGMNIPEYAPGSYQNHEPTRPRKLLLHRREIRKLGQQIAEKRLTLVPTRIYFTRGIVKVELALARGKVKYEKRESIKEREDRRRMDREMSRRR